MKQRVTVVILLSGVVVGGGLAVAAEVVQWQQIVGRLQAGHQVGTGTGQVTGGGQPRHRIDGRPEVDVATGRRAFEGRGFVLAGGKALGTPGAVTQVKGPLVCDTTGTVSGNSVLEDTAWVPLRVQGKPRFSGPVSPLP